MKKFVAFTLAEVLITLSIIGVVAALTMPSLVAKYQKNLWVNQLKKSYSMTSQALKKIMADEETDSLANTSILAEDYGLQKYLKVISFISDDRDADIIQYSIEDRGERYIDDNISDFLAHGTEGYNLADGSILYFDKNNGNIFFDVNGNKTPNTLDRDLFQFVIQENGLIKPYVALRTECHTVTITNCVGGGKMGQGCTQQVCNANPVEDLDQAGCGAARIMRAGWKMEY